MTKKQLEERVDRLLDTNKRLIKIIEYNLAEVERLHLDAAAVYEAMDNQLFQLYREESEKTE